MTVPSLPPAQIPIGIVTIPGFTPPKILSLTYFDPDGHIWPLIDTTGLYRDTDIDYDDLVGTASRGKYTGQFMERGYVCSAIAGIEGVPVMMQTIPLLDGTAIPSVYIPQTGTIGLAILIGRPTGGTSTDYYNLLDRFVRAFYHRRNMNPSPGILRVTRPDGTSRQIFVYTTTGLNTPEVGVNNMSLYSLSLATPDPYWTDVQQTQKDFKAPNANAGIAFYQTSQAPPWIQFPANGSAGISFNSPHTIGASIYTNNGDSYAYPTWILTGPGKPTIQNITANRSWGLDFSLADGQQVQVITTRGHQSVVDMSSGTNLWSHLVMTGPRDLWPLLAGDNNINVTMAGMNADSQITMSFYNRWQRA